MQPSLPTPFLLLQWAAVLTQSPTQVFVLPPLQAYCLAPFDLIKVRLQNQMEPRARPGSPPPRYRGPVHCAVSICREDGPWGLFRGAWALTLRDTPTLGIYFVTYEWLCRQSTPDRQNPGEWSGMRGWGTERSGGGELAQAVEDAEGCWGWDGMGGCCCSSV